MRVLIGTPIHQVKDYAMERWLENVVRLQRVSPADLFLIDNSEGTDYVKKVKGYCIKYGIKNYRIKHFKIDQKLGPDIRIETSQEMLRQFVLASGYDALFSWECDQIIPTNTLDKLISIMKMGNFMMVVANSRARLNPEIPNTNMGITLISKDCLKKNWFLPKLGDGKISLKVSDTYDVNDPTVFKKRVLSSGNSYIDVYGVIEPVYHLNE